MTEQILIKTRTEAAVNRPGGKHEQSNHSEERLPRRPDYFLNAPLGSPPVRTFVYLSTGVAGSLLREQLFDNASNDYSSASSSANSVARRFFSICEPTKIASS